MRGRDRTLMASAGGQGAPPRVRTFAPWRVVTWLFLLLAAFGCVQYARHASLAWAKAQALAPGSTVAAAALHRMLAWDIAYLLVALVFIVLCAGCILRQGWARIPLRVAACVLAVWVVVTGMLLLLQWQQFDRASADALAQLQADPALQQALLHARRSYQLALGLKVVAVPLLLWLAWRLGVPSVRAQFRARSRHAPPGASIRP